MMAVTACDSLAAVTEQARLILEAAGVGDRLPTPIDDILACAGLVVASDVTLEERLEVYRAHEPDVLRSALRKTMGLVDLRENVVYLDQGVLPQKRAFLKLHEAGHKLLPWQRHHYLALT